MKEEGEVGGQREPARKSTELGAEEPNRNIVNPLSEQVDKGETSQQLETIRGEIRLKEEPSSVPEDPFEHFEFQVEKLLKPSAVDAIWRWARRKGLSDRAPRQAAVDRILSQFPDYANDRVRRSATEGREGVVNSSAIEAIALHGTLEQQLHALDMLDSLQSDEFPHMRSMAHGLIAILYQSPYAEVREKVDSRVQSIIQRAMVAPDTMLDAWEDSSDENQPRSPDVHEVFNSNIVVLEELERIRPDRQITKTLVESFNIHNLGRFSLDTLIAQFDERDDTDTPYGILFYPKIGGFYGEGRKIEKLRQRLKGKMNIRIVEVGGKKDFREVLQACKEKYGKSSFGILAAHGNATGTEMGYGDEGQLDIDFFEDPEVQEQMRSSFHEGANFLFNSCSTGKVDNTKNVAQSLSKSGLTTIAPLQPVRTFSYEVKEDSKGKINLMLHYDEEEIYTKSGDILKTEAKSGVFKDGILMK